MEPVELLWVSPEMYRTTNIIAALNDIKAAELIIKCAFEWLDDDAAAYYNIDGRSSFLFRPSMELQFAMNERAQQSDCDDVHDAYRSALLYHKIKHKENYAELVNLMFKD